MDAIDRLALWLLAVGVWPFADPGHDLNTLLSVTDVLVHVAAAVVLAVRWKIVRRTWHVT